MAGEQFDWDDLRYVLAIARTGSLVGAARALAVNHSSVYRRLAALEARLAVRLFERRRSGYQVTAQGRTLVDAAVRIEGEALAAQRRVAGTESKLSGTIRVGTNELLGYYLLPSLLRDFASRYPDVETVLSIDNRLADLKRRDADVVLRATEKPPEYLLGRRIAAMACCAYAQRDYMARVGRGRPLEDYDWLGFDGALAHIPQARWLHARLPQARHRFRFDTSEALHHCTRAGIGLGVLPCFVGDREPELERVTPPDTFGNYGVWVLTHPDLRRNARIRAFMREIGAMIATQEPLLAGDRPFRFA